MFGLGKKPTKEVEGVEDGETKRQRVRDERDKNLPPEQREQHIPGMSTFGDGGRVASNAQRAGRTINK